MRTNDYWICGGVPTRALTLTGLVQLVVVVNYQKNSGWNCEMRQKDFNQSMTEASRPKTIKRKLQILSHECVSIKVITHNFR